MRLFDYFRSSASYRVRIALNLKGIEAALDEVHLVKDGGQQHSDVYRELNPQGRVPTLLTDDGQILSQSMAILEYLEETHPKPALLPSDPVQRAHVRAMADLVACDIHPLNNLSILQYLKRELEVTEQQKNAWYAHWIIEGFTAIEKTLQATADQYCFGNSITLADVCLIPQVYNARRFKVDTEPFPLIEKIYDNCLDHKAFAQADPDCQPGAQVK